MPKAVLERILAQLDSLEPGELERVGDAVQKRLAPREAEQKRRAFHEALLATGLVRQLRPPRSTTDRGRDLIQVQGKPVSETIIEERR